MTEAAETRNKSRHRAHRLRFILMLVVPLVLVGGGAYVWLSDDGSVDTDNAYVKAPLVDVAPEVSGPVTAVAVKENAQVTAGDVLFRIDPEPFQIALDSAQATLESARTQIKELKASYSEAKAQLDLAQTTLTYAEKDLHRQQKLARKNVVSQSRLDAASEDVDSARKNITVLEQELARIAAKLGGNPDAPVDDHPTVRQAKSALDQARLDLKRTTVHAPIAGVAGHLPDQGDTVTAGKSAMTLVGTNEVWIEANFKETQLTWLRDGQPATVEIDTYPDRVFHGHVTSISRATGAEFSVLPPQNATGNWVKVVQRIPVRIAVTPDDDEAPLRAGMSAEVVVSTGHADTALPGPIAGLASWFGIETAKAKSP